MQPVAPFGAFTPQAAAVIDQNFLSLTPLFRNVYYLDPANGYDGNTGLAPGLALKTIGAGYAKLEDGRNDAVALIGNGATSATARIDTAFTWAKSAAHFVGLSSGVNLSNRSRLAPSSGTTAFANFFAVSGNGCLFQNLQWFQGFGTGTTSQIAMTVTGGRNLFSNCHIAGMGDNESAQSAGSRSLKISGTGENQFVNCTIGVDTVTRTQANASVEFAGATPRNQFKDCEFPFMTSAAGVLGILGTGASCMDRFQRFDNCDFINAIKSSSTTMTVLASLTNASPGGLLLFKQCILLGITDYGDTIGLANSYIDGFTGAAATSGIAVNPS